MPPKSRVTATLFWGGALGTMLLLIAWAAGAAWRPFVYVDRETSITLTHCDLYLSRDIHVPPSLHETRRQILASGPAWGWRPRFRESKGNLNINLPYWTLLTPALLAAGVGWFLRSQIARRARGNLCLRCGYTRAGIGPDVPCPECGHTPAP